MISYQQQEDKGLFTFYRQQAEKEQQIKRSKKRLKEIKLQGKLPQKKQNKAYCPKQRQDFFQKLSRGRNQNSQVNSFEAAKNYKESPEVRKRLVESVVDMQRYIKQKDDHSNSKAKQPLFYIKKLRKKHQSFQNNKNAESIQTRRYSKLNEMNDMNEEILVKGSINSQSLELKKQKQDLKRSHSPPPIQKNQSDIELPEIVNYQNQYKPRKVKSRIVQEAIHCNDRKKIQKMREYLKRVSAISNVPPFEFDEAEFYGLDEKQYQVFSTKQQKLLGIMKRFRRR